MRTKIWLGLTAATAAIFMAQAGAAQAQSADSFFQKILGTSDDAPPINYSDRAPLVNPSKIDLPPPGSATSTATDPNWPKDPDEKKRKAAGIIPKTKPERGDGRLSPEEMANGRLDGTSAADSAPEPFNAAKTSSVPLKPIELQKKLNLGEDKTPLVAGQEPPRRSLTEPPPGYRTPLASAPLGGDEPLPSQANESAPWYERIFKTPKSH
jgi:hypothetical protein